MREKKVKLSRDKATIMDKYQFKRQNYIIMC